MHPSFFRVRDIWLSVEPTSRIGRRADIRLGSATLGYIMHTDPLTTVAETIGEQPGAAFSVTITGPDEEQRTHEALRQLLALLAAQTHVHARLAGTELQMPGNFDVWGSR